MLFPDKFLPPAYDTLSNKEEREMGSMKVQLRQRLRREEKTVLRQWVRSSFGKTAGSCGAAALAGFVLAGARLGAVQLPLAVALTAALGLGLPAFSAYAGSCVGAG